MDSKIFLNTILDRSQYNNDNDFYKAVIDYYENPSNKIVNISITDFLNNVKEFCNIELYDILFDVRCNKFYNTEILYLILYLTSEKIFENYDNLSLEQRLILLSDFGQIKKFDTPGNLLIPIMYNLGIEEIIYIPGIEDLRKTINVVSVMKELDTFRLEYYKSYFKII